MEALFDPAMPLVPGSVNTTVGSVLLGNVQGDRKVVIDFGSGIGAAPGTAEVTYLARAEVTEVVTVEHSTTLRWFDSDLGSNQVRESTVAAVTTSVPVAVIPQLLDFGQVQVGTVSAARSFQIQNLSAVTRNPGFVTDNLTHPNFDVVTSSGCAVTSTPVCGSCNYPLQYVPDEVGIDTADFFFDDGPTLYGVTTRGQGVATVVPDLIARDAAGRDIAAVDFGRQPIGQQVTMEVLLANAGATDLQIDGIELQAAVSTVTRLESEACSGQVVTAATSCPLVLAFAPRQNGPVTAALAIESNDPDTPRLNLEIEGIGGGPREIPQPVAERPRNVPPTPLAALFLWPAGPTVSIGAFPCHPATARLLSTNCREDAAVHCRPRRRLRR